MSMAVTARTESAKGKARKERILQAAMRRIARRGARGTTLAEIARDAGVSQAGLIYHFPTKDELLHALLDRRDAADRYLSWPDGQEPGIDVLVRIANVVRSWSADTDVLVGMLSMLVFENIDEHSTLHARLIEGYNRGVERLAQTLRAGQAAGTVRRDVDVRHKAIEFIAFINGLENAWLMNPSIPSAEIALQWARDQERALRPE